MKIGIGSDHRGYLKKQNVIKILQTLGYDVIDYGTNSEDSVDYPDFAFKVSEDVRDNKLQFGVLICANGIGMAIASNKVKNIRCAKVSNVSEAKHSRIDNNCNVIALGSDLSISDIEEILTTFFNTKFNNEERFVRRIKKVDNYEH